MQIPLKHRQLLILVAVVLLLGGLPAARQTDATGAAPAPSAPTSSIPALPSDTLFYDPIDAQVDNVGSAPQDFTPLSDTQVLFTAVTSDTGRELWTTDGTLTGTQLLADIDPGPASSDPIHLTVIDGEVWFWAFDATDGPRKLWRSDGTVSGTMPLSVAYEHVDEIVPGEIAKLNARLFFVGVDAAGGAELWRSNGAADTTRVKDINPGIWGSDPHLLTVYDGWLYFAVADGLYMGGLWRTDRTAANTTQVYPLHTITALLATPQGLYISGMDKYGTCGVWRSDGTAAGTTQIATVCARMLTDVNGTLAFTSADQRTLYISDGTPLGSQAVYSDTLPIMQLVAGQGRLGTNTLYFFQSGEPAPSTINVSPYRVDSHLWRYDIGGNMQLIDPSGLQYGYTISDLAVVNETLLFGADTHAYTVQESSPHWSVFQLYQYDGSATSAITAVSTNLAASELTAWGQRLIFQGDAKASSICCRSNSEPWLSDGTAAGTTQIKDLAAAAPVTQPLRIATVNNALVATHIVEDGLLETELRIVDLSTNSVVYTAPAWCPELHKLVQPDQTERLVGPCRRGNSMRMFSTDGSATGSGDLFDLNHAVTPPQFYVDADNGSTLWATFVGDQPRIVRTDGTLTGTVDIAFDFTFEQPLELEPLGNTLLFSTRSTAASNSYTLWSQPAGMTTTMQLASRSSIHSLTRLGDTIYFASGAELWRTDGTVAGTRMVQNFTNPLGPTKLRDFFVFNQWLYFRVDTGSAVQWRTDGTTIENTYNELLAASPIESWQVSGSTLYFASWSLMSGFEIAGMDNDLHLTMATNINPGRADGLNPSAHFSDPLRPDMAPTAFALHPVPGGVVFAVNDGRHGYELWYATPSYATRLSDTAPGVASGLYRQEPRTSLNPRLWSLYGAYDQPEYWAQSALNQTFDPDVLNLPSSAISGNALYWVANDLAHGPAVHRLPLTALGRLSAPPRTVSRNQNITLAVQIDNQSLAVTPLSVTLTLEPGLSYAGDSSGLTPTIDGQQITWTIPAQANTVAAWEIQLQLLDVPVSAARSATLSSPQMPSAAVVRATIISGSSAYLPLMRR